MSDDARLDPEDTAPVDDGDDKDYEEITSDEVDRVVEALETLMATVDSENIRFYLEEATSAVYHLIYEDDEEELQDEAA
jgi:hypothetical protein